MCKHPCIPLLGNVIGAEKMGSRPLDYKIGLNLSRSPIKYSVIASRVLTYLIQSSVNPIHRFAEGLSKRPSLRLAVQSLSQAIDQNYSVLELEPPHHENPF
jgi:hypothetical protein